MLPSSFPGRGRTPPRSAVVAMLLVLVPASLTVSLTPLTGVVVPTHGHPTTPTINGTLVNGSVLGTHSGSPFFEVVFNDNQLPTNALVRIGAYLNATPISLVRFGGSGEGYDPTTQTDYLPPSSGSGTYVATSQMLWNLTWFKSWCDARTPHCAWLGYLPGEQNNTTAAVHTARWYHSVLGFVPTFWEFGNEPTQWTHYGLNVTRWSTSDNSTPSALDYATMVHNYISAISRLYPSDRYVGIEATCACNRQLVAMTAQVDGGLVSSLAYHSYPTTANSTTSLSAFYGLLSSPANLSATSARFRSAIVQNCTACGGLPVSVGEYQAGPPTAFSPFASQYAGAPFLAGSFIEAIEANVSSWATFNTGSLYNASSGNVSFEGTLYQQIFQNLTMGTDYNVTVRTAGMGGLLALRVMNGTRDALLVVNTNLTYSLNVVVPSTVFPTGGSGDVWLWPANALTPNHGTFGTLPRYYTVPSQGILLVANY